MLEPWRRVPLAHQLENLLPWKYSLHSHDCFEQSVGIGLENMRASESCYFSYEFPHIFYLVAHIAPMFIVLIQCCGAFIPFYIYSEEICPSSLSHLASQRLRWDIYLVLLTLCTIICYIAGLAREGASKYSWEWPTYHINSAGIS